MYGNVWWTRGTCTSKLRVICCSVIIIVAYLLTFWKSLEVDLPLSNSKKRKILRRIVLQPNYFFENGEVLACPENDLFLPDIVWKLTKFHNFNFKLLVLVNKLAYNIEIWYIAQVTNEQSILHIFNAGDLEGEKNECGRF